MKGIIYRGTVVEADVDVVDGRSIGCWWNPSTTKHARHRDPSVPVRFGVFHHQAGEGQAKSVYSVLESRRLSVHFEIDQNGTITQMCDLDDVALQAGENNEHSWGVEIANLGLPPATKKWPRGTYKDVLHGNRIEFLSFFDVQKKAAVDLGVAVNKILGLPVLTPCLPPSTPARAYRGVLPAPFLATHRGFVAHYMLTTNKIDPSPDLMDHLVLKCGGVQVP